MKKKPQLYVALDEYGDLLNDAPMPLKELEKKVVNDLESNCYGKIIICALTKVKQYEYKGVVGTKL